MNLFDPARLAVEQASVEALRRSRKTQAEDGESAQNRRVAYGEKLGFPISLNLAMKLYQFERSDARKK